MAKISAHRIVRRAFGQFSEVEVLEVTWVAAMNIAMAMEAYNRDGEYLVYFADEAYPRPVSPSVCPAQAAFAYI